MVQPVTTTTAALTLGQATNGSITTPGQINSFTFTLSKATSLVLGALADSLNASYPYDSSLTWTLTGPNGFSLSRALNYSDGTIFGAGNPAIALAAGAYTLSFSATTAQTGTYSFRLLDLAAATAITPGTPVTGTLSPGSDTRAYSFTATAGQTVYVDQTTYSGGSLTWRLLDPLGNVVFFDGFYTTPGSFTLATAGTYTLLLEGYVGDAGRTISYGFTVYGNTSSSPIPIDSSGNVQAPDLAVTNVTATATGGIQSGSNVTIAWSDTNQGGLATDATWTDRVIVKRADNGEILANVSLPYTGAALAAGAAAARSTTIKLPDGNDGAGALVISITTDVGNTVSEANSAGTGFTNNTTTLNVTSTVAAYPDLQVTNVSLSPGFGFQGGDTVIAHWTLTNAGNAAVSGNFAEQISIKNLQTGAVIVLKTDTVTGPVAAGATQARTLSFTWPAGLSSTGNFEIDVTADSTGQVVEAVPFSQRTDNTGTTTALSAPDLVVTGLAVTNSAALQSSDTVNLSWVDQNQGNTDTPVDWNDRVRVVNTTTGAVIIDQSVDAGGVLAAGAQRTRTLSFKLPDGTAGVGSLSISVTADQTNNGTAVITEAECQTAPARATTRPPSPRRPPCASTPTSPQSPPSPPPAPAAPR